MTDETKPNNMGEAVAAVAVKVKELHELEARIAKGEALLKDLNAEARNLREKVLPDLFQQAEMSYIAYDGLEYAVTPFVNVTIPADVKRDAYQWLHDNGHGGIIKATVTATFGAGDEQANQIYKLLQEQGVSPELEEKIHAQTLSKFGRECMEQGLELPEQFFSVYAGNTIKATKVKGKK